MKLSAFLCSYGHLFDEGKSIRQVIDQAAKDGFGAIEPFPMSELQDAEAADDVRRYVGDRGLSVSCYSACIDLTANSAEDTIAELKREIDIAGALGSPLFHHTVYPPLALPGARGIKAHEALRRVVPILKETCAYASDKGVLCAFEDQGMMFNGIRGMSMLVDALGETKFGLVADLGNIMFVDETAEAYIAAFSQYIVHVHCKDYLWKPGSVMSPGNGWYITRNGNFLRDTIIGHGAANYPAILRVLKQIGYDGWYSLEYGGPERPEYGIRLSVDNLKRTNEMIIAEETPAPTFRGVYPVFDEV